MKKDNFPLYLMIFLIFIGFCNIMEPLINIDILVAVINGLFILFAAIYGTNTLAKKNQMHKYSEEIEKSREKIMDLLQEIVYDIGLLSYKEKYKISESQGEDIEDRIIDSQNNYNKMIIDYRILLREIQLYCDAEIECEFKRIDSWDVKNNRVIFEDISDPTRTFKIIAENFPINL